ncbi:putative translation elongation factor EF1B/ribosomal protein S6 [Helianthus annuus]|nr:putative translation elongation factor EF1B/ribosomal protein S6 [Helianthus annuus]KAJ0814869.1 putative translation elongation factor EF1B/ribosomal protein S6 [Helianthus annuus]
MFACVFEQHREKGVATPLPVALAIYDVPGLPPLDIIEDMSYEKNTRKSTRADIERQIQEEIAKSRTEKEKKAAEDRAAAVKASTKKKESGTVLMDIKPWDDETDMQNLEEAVRSVQMEGLLWGASKLVPVGYGIKKLQIMLTIVDDLVSVDTLFEEHLTVEPINEYVQSCDIVAFNKICKFFLVPFLFLYKVYQHLYYDAVSVVLWSCFNHCCVDVRLATDFMSDYVCSDF